MLNKIAEERLGKILAILEANSIRFPLAEIVKRMKVDKGMASAYLNGKKPISEKFYTTFLSVFPNTLSQEIDNLKRSDTRAKHEVPDEIKVKFPGILEIVGELKEEILRLRVSLGVLEQMVDLSVSQQTGKSIGIVSAERRQAVAMETEQLLSELRNKNR